MLLCFANLNCIRNDAFSLAPSNLEKVVTLEVFIDAHFIHLNAEIHFGSINQEQIAGTPVSKAYQTLLQPITSRGRACAHALTLGSTGLELVLCVQ